MKTPLHPMRYFCCLFIFFSIFFSGSAWSGDVKRILILPFAVHAEKDLSYLKNGVYDMLSSRLAQEGKVVPVSKEESEKIAAGVAGPMDGKMAGSLARGVGADYVIFGSLTVFGESISTDARCVDVARNAPVVTFNQAGKSQGDVITHINRFATQVNEQVFGRKDAAYATAPPEQGIPDARKHPDKIWQESKGGAFVYGAAATEGLASFVAWKSRKFKGDIRGLSVGDVNNDGKNEVVFISHSTIFIYRYEEGRFTRVAEIVEKRYNGFIGVDVADINRNGAAEVFITNFPAESDTLSSFVLEWNGSTFEKIIKSANRYYRVFTVPGRGKVLMGQARGMLNDSFGLNSLFEGRVSELKWQNNQLVVAEKQLLPRGVNIYGFALGDLLNDGSETVAAFTPRNFVRVYDRKGDVEWTSDGRYGGSATYIDLRLENTYGNSRGVDGKRFEKQFIRQRLHIVDLDGDKKNELIVVKNHNATGDFLEQTRYFKSGHIEALTWDTIGMRIKWKTQKTGYISDYVIGDLNNDGKDEMVFSVVLTSGPILGKSRSYISSLALKATGKKESPQ